jgi:DNA-binding transcriptional regulator YiaG
MIEYKNANKDEELNKYILRQHQTGAEEATVSRALDPGGAPAASLKTCKFAGFPCADFRPSLLIKHAMSTTKTKKKAAKKRAFPSPAKETFAIKSGPALKTWRQERGISRPLFAQIADCSERTLATYEGKTRLPVKFSRPVAESVRLILALQELAGDNAALKEWLVKPNAAFDKRTPLSLIKSGEVDVLWRMVHQIRQGSFA